MPPAPKPTYNSNGHLMTDWLIVCRYDAARDCLTMSWTRDGDRFHRTQQGALALPHDELDVLVESFRDQAEVLHARRLF